MRITFGRSAANAEVSVKKKRKNQAIVIIILHHIYFLFASMASIKIRSITLGLIRSFNRFKVLQAEVVAEFWEISRFADKEIGMV